MAEDETLAERVDEIRGKWWQDWEDMNDGHLPFDIGQGWDSAWDCVEQHILPLIAKAWDEGADVGRTEDRDTFTETPNPYHEEVNHG